MKRVCIVWLGRDVFGAARLVGDHVEGSNITKEKRNQVT